VTKLADSAGLTRKQRLLLEKLPDFYSNAMPEGLLLEGGEKRTAQSLVDRRLAICGGPGHFFRTQTGRAHVVLVKEE